MNRTKWTPWSNILRGIMLLVSCSWVERFWEWTFEKVNNFCDLLQRNSRRNATYRTNEHYQRPKLWSLDDQEVITRCGKSQHRYSQWDCRKHERTLSDRCRPQPNLPDSHLMPRRPTSKAKILWYHTSGISGRWKKKNMESWKAQKPNESNLLSFWLTDWL